MGLQQRRTGAAGRALATIALFMCALIMQGNVKPASAQLALNTANGHYYEAVSAPGITWEQANAAAQARSVQGVTGHLATITSQAENDFITSTFPSATGSGYWLGGFQAPGSVEPAGGWQWVTGEPFVYTNWPANQPNNFLGQEDRLHFLSSGQWDDAVGSTHYTGYVVEYDTSTTAPTPTPIPTTTATPTPPPSGGFRIIGRISNSSSTAIPNVTVTRTGTGQTTSITNSAGYYVFSNVPNGTYTVTPGSNGLAFTPVSRSVTVNGADRTGQNFVGGTAAATFSFTGRITDNNGNPLQNVAVTREGNITVFTNSAGYYTFAGLPAGTYTVTPTIQGFSFTPTSRTATITDASVEGQNFTGSTGTIPPATFGVSGRVSNSSGTQLPGVDVTATLQSAPGTTVTVQTNSAGYYSFNGLPAGTYIIAPGASGLNFTPQSRTVTVTNSNLSGLNFIGSSGPPPAPTFNVSGRVSNSNGDAIPNVTVTRTGTGQTTVTTNSAGFYTFTNVPNGNFTITPSASGLSFTPPSRSVVVNGTDLTAQNFVGGPAAPTFTLIGRITDDNGNPLQNVAVTREGNITVLSNSAGYYTFAGLPAGTYTVTPTIQGYNFTPTSRTATITNANVEGQNFVGTTGPLPVATFSVSGRVSTSNGTAIEGANVTATLQGDPGTVVTIQTNSAGYFTFGGLPRGTYVLTVRSGDLTFTPVTRTVIVDNANITGQNFISG